MNILNIGDSILLSVKRLGINGEGIGYYKKEAVFVDGALPGEEVEAKIIDIGNGYAKGIVTNIKTKSSYRVEAKCPHYGKCGGCNLLHLNYKAQLHEKTNMVIETFNRYYNGDVSHIKFNDCVGMTNPLGYRNKTSLPLRFDGSRVVSGLYAKDSNRLVYIDSCLMENEFVQDSLHKVLDYLTSKKVSIYNPKTREGIIRYVVIRAFDKENIQVTFVLSKKDQNTINILKDTPLPSVFYTINNDPKNIEIINNDCINIKGNEKINGMLGDLKFDISPRSFFQLNTCQTTTLYELVKKRACLTVKENVLDCYCGIGSIGLYVAKDAKEVRGIDINKDGINDANRFAKANNINNASFYSGNIIPYLHQFKDKGFIPDVVIVDPPRKGLDLNLISYLKDSNVKHIVYVSCNPATLVKNINNFGKKYSVESVDIVDMFPNTSHVETVVLITRKEK